MQSILNLTEIASINELLSRLDPAPREVCDVPGCVHMHVTSTRQEGVPALAA